MAVSFDPITPDPGQLVTAKLQYTGPNPPPTDVHVDVQRPDGSWQAVTGYDTLPQGVDPTKEVALPFSLGNPVFEGTGVNPKLRVRWTWNGVDDPQRNEATGLTLTSWWLQDTRSFCRSVLGPNFNCVQVLKSIGQVWGKRGKGS
jgi:hypothetical protein